MQSTKSSISSSQAVGLLQFPQGRLIIALVAGLLMGLTPAPANAWFLAWIALAPLWTLVRSLDQWLTVNRSRAFLYGLVWGIGYHGLALWWIRDLHPLMWLGIPWLGSIATVLFAWVFITLWGAVLAGSWACLFHTLCHWPLQPFRSPQLPPPSLPSPLSPPPFPLWLRILLGTALWCALEWLWSYGPLYWSSLAYTQSPRNLLILHLGQLSGPTVVTGAIVAGNGLLAETWIRWRQKAVLPARHLLGFTLVFVIGLHLIGLGLYSQPLANAPSTALKIGIIQGNVPTRIKQFEDGMRLALQHYTMGYETLAEQGVDAVLTPEGAFPWLWLNTPRQAQHPFYQEIERRQIPAWVGTIVSEPNGFTQSLVTITGTGDILSRYDKIKLVPLGEYIPLRSIFGGFINRLSPVQATLIPGQPNQQLDTPFGQAIAGICFDSAFPWLFRRQAATGGTFILTASNNDPYGASMMTQHHAQDVMRAIETDRWVARATNTGFSSIIDAHGNTRWISGFRTYETHADIIYRRHTQTLYVRWGDWLTPSLLAIGLVSRGLYSSRVSNKSK
ncbi:apolipoprotein N-acyltransferase [Thermocoleostomius sinensis]|uniref:Apolipoprotein N-acyltransferase n=1 Tax=Thermocoleostomius sinensis A174 TaxID=2016057 RepID=A0A9E8ZBG8_9CYAN|nr:apolipoprotein N-acyltransferase [Thermocoleostomius sinensis]WAL60159.1 apolipoprotein N-acyltransferase [Thermocoleostomius sinensis A174]